MPQVGGNYFFHDDRKYVCIICCNVGQLSNSGADNENLVPHVNFIYSTHLSQVIHSGFLDNDRSTTEMYIFINKTSMRI